MSKKIAIEARISDYFATEPLAAARTMLAVVTRTVAQRINAEDPSIGKPAQTFKRVIKKAVKRPATPPSTPEPPVA